MTRGMEHDLIRLLHGEMPEAEARELRARLRREPELAAAYERLERTWSLLSLPDPAPVPPGFTGRVMARVRQQPPGLSWAAAPAWAKATAAAALLAGMVLGAGAGAVWPVQEESLLAAEVPIASEDSDLSLAESYWTAVEEATAEILQ
jgi:ferric-dicitrate binding protein FerR (iron transport regulator)